jgi:hypothetical protein
MTSTAPDKLRRRNIVLSLLQIILLLAAGQVAKAQTPGPDLTRYTVGLASSPADGASAHASFAARAETYTEFMACGQENVFLELASRDPSSFNDLNILTRVMAKLWWWKQQAPRDCAGAFNVIHVVGSPQDFYCPLNAAANLPTCAANQTAADAAVFTQQFTDRFGAACADSTVTVTASAGTAPSSFAAVKSHLSRRCLGAQINYVLSQLKRNGQFPGSAGLPCDLSTLGDPPIAGITTQGDWDMRMTALIRMLFLDRQSVGNQSPSVLGSYGTPTGYPNDSSLWGYVQNELISVDGAAGPDSYSWTACGDNEAETGAPQDREDENGSSDGIFDSIGDILSWLFHRLVLILVFLGVGAVLVYVAGLTFTAVAALAAIAGIAAILAGQIPESENHRLMIESARFLNNQLTIDELGGSANAPNLTSAQASVKQWLLKKFQYLARNDFDEFNARPYHGFSLNALRNLADFASDPDIKTGAQMLIEYSDAKFSTGSNQNRRLVPFRRHFAAVDCIDGHGCAGATGLPDNNNYAELLNDFVQLGDSSASFGLLFNGQTQQLPGGLVSSAEPPTAYGKAAGDPTAGEFGGAVGDAYAAATSNSIADASILDLAIRKDVPYFQRIHHAGYEVYSSSPSALITAGGLKADHATPISIAGVKLSNPFGADDLGAGVPTTVMFPGVPNVVVPPQGFGAPPTVPTPAYTMSLDTFISFRGTRETDHGSETFTDNLCVWQNFACGTNVRIPPAIAACLIHNTQGGTGVPVGPHWYFLDSSLCGYSMAPRFVVVLYLICPSDQCNADLSNVGAGFLEVIDNPTDLISTLEANVVRRNPASVGLANLGQGCLTSTGTCTGHYHTMNGATSHDLTIHLRGHQDDAQGTGIAAIDGANQPDIGDWPLAVGDIINSKGDGVITIHNPRLGTVLTLDFSNPDHPCRRASATSACVQL